jgi:hypothetical protein
MKKKKYHVMKVDFDGTLCVDQYPGIGVANRRFINDLIDARRNGHKIILDTCRTGNLLDEAVRWCKAHGLEFDAVNKNLPERTAEFGGDCRKISADFGFDDRSIHPAALKDWPLPLILKTLELHPDLPWGWKNEGPMEEHAKPQSH